VSHYPDYKSKQEDFVPSGNIEFADFVPLRGGKGGRVVIDAFVLRIFGTITVAGAVWDGRDVWRLINHITVETRSGRQRWSLSGFKSRMASIKFNGIERHQEHADVAIGAAQAVDLYALIPMRKRKVRRGKDYAMPADVFRKITITWNSLAGAATAATVLTVDSLDAYVLAQWHEENGVEIKAEDQVKSINFTSNTQVTAKLNGALHDAFICREPAGGGTVGGDVITAITDVRCDELNMAPLLRQDLVHQYTEKNAVAPSGLTSGAERFKDPFRDGKALPVFTSDPDTKLWDGRVVENATFNVGTGAASLNLVTREVLKKSESDFHAQAAQYGINPASLRMKTAGKTRRGLGDGWTKRQKGVAVWSAPLPQADD
jgi:hypothetical protein